MKGCIDVGNEYALLPPILVSLITKIITFLIFIINSCTCICAWLLKYTHGQSALHSTLIIIVWVHSWNNEHIMSVITITTFSVVYLAQIFAFSLEHLFIVNLLFNHNCIYYSLHSNRNLVTTAILLCHKSTNECTAYIVFIQHL